MIVSIIINSKNEEKNIENCLRSILAQTYPEKKIEIIVVDNNSTDKTKEIALKFTRSVHNIGPERSAQKNYGVRQSKGEYFIHLDADMALSRKVVEKCVSGVKKDKNTIALYIPEIVAGEKFFSKVRRFERSFYDGTVIDAVRFIRKDKFLDAGGFDEHLYAAEDWDLNKRLNKIGRLDIVESPLYHNEEEFKLSKYIKKKGYYSKNLDVYIEKWGKNDPDIKKQFGFYYRFFGVFLENGKWKYLLRHPALTLGMYFLRAMVGLRFLLR